MTSRNKILRIVLLLLRLVIGGVFVYAAWIKLREPWMLFAISIDAYGVLPEWAVTAIARTLPWFELAIGLLLIAGRFLRVSTVATTALLAVFFSLMVRAYIKHQTIDCGCFGPGEAISPLTLLRDGSMLLGSGFLAVMAFRRKRSVPQVEPEPSMAGQAEL